MVCVILLLVPVAGITGQAAAAVIMKMLMMEERGRRAIEQQHNEIY
jgi:hypothetical protein